jgi:hypothetical protein
MGLIDRFQERIAIMISNSSSGYAADSSGKSHGACDPPGGAVLIPIIVSATILTETAPGGQKPLGIELVFNTQMDPASTRNPANYQLLEAFDSAGTPKFRPLPLVASYNPATQSVALVWREKAEFLLGGLFTVNGTAPQGVMDAFGVFLAGGDNGAIGTNATFLVLPSAIGLLKQWGGELFLADS